MVPLAAAHEAAEASFAGRCCAARGPPIFSTPDAATDQANRYNPDPDTDMRRTAGIDLADGDQHERAYHIMIGDALDADDGPWATGIVAHSIANPL